jgi:hypothetical protein
MPERNARYEEGESVTVAYECSAAPDASIGQCEGPVGNGGEIRMKEGTFNFKVVAIDTKGRRSRASVSYTVDGPGPPPKRDTTKPTVDLRTPADGMTYYLDALPDVEYTCSDDRDGADVKCEAPLDSGAQLDMKPGSYRFPVTAIDRAGNDRTVTHDYVIRRRPRGPERPRTNTDTGTTTTDPPVTVETTPVPPPMPK